VRGLAAQLEKTSIDRLILTSRSNLFYLTSLWPIGQTFLSISRSGQLEVFGSRLDFFLTESDEVKVFAGRGEADILESMKRSIAAAEDKYVEVDHPSTVSEKLRASPGFAIVPGNRMVERMRSAKDEQEVECLKRSAELAKEGMKAALEEIREGVTEREVARAAHIAMVDKGAEETAFEISVGSGWRSSLPHAIPTDKEMERGELVVVDLGADLEHYKSDMTRTQAIGSPEGQGRKLLDAVMAAYDACLGGVAPDVKASDLASKCDSVLTSAGFSEGILHGLGHGVGLDIHEEPTLSTKSADTLIAGHVVTIEPGVYLRGIMGARWENTVLVTKAGHEVLT